VFPAYQRFHSCDLSGLKIEFGLVMQQKLIAAQRVAQIPFQQLPLCQPRVHVPPEELIVVPPALFDFVHRSVRFVHQAFRVRAVAGIGAHSNAHANVHTLVIDNMRLRERSKDFLRAHCRVFPILHLREQYDKFVAAHSAYGVRPPDTSH
jgi:hypothetical protein